MNNEQVLRTLRGQAWSRAKGELEAVLQTFWGKESAREDQFHNLDELITKFVEKVDSEGLHE